MTQLLLIEAERRKFLSSFGRFYFGFVLAYASVCAVISLLNAGERFESFMNACFLVVTCVFAFCQVTSFFLLRLTEAEYHSRIFLVVCLLAASLSTHAQMLGYLAYDAGDSYLSIFLLIGLYFGFVIQKDRFKQYLFGYPCVVFILIWPLLK